MTSVRRRIAAVLVVAGCALALAGCTDSDSGNPTPTGSVPTTGSGSPAPTVEIPPRTEELRVDGLEPCSLITEGQRQELKVSRARGTVSSSEHYNGDPECVLEVRNSGTTYDYVLLLTTREDVSVWLTGKRNVESSLESVAGFPAATYYFRGATNDQASGCDTSVGVASGQQIIVSHEEGTNGAFTLDKMCEMSRRVAELAVTTLQGLR